MSILKQISINQRKSDGGQSLLKSIGKYWSKLSELFWFCLSFLLFLLMGPFSVFAVIIGLCSLAGEKNRSTMTEPASI